MDFKQAYNRLQEINSLIKSESILDIDQLILLQKEAENLFNYLKEHISKHTGNH